MIGNHAFFTVILFSSFSPLYTFLGSHFLGVVKFHTQKGWGYEFSLSFCKIG